MPATRIRDADPELPRPFPSGWVVEAEERERTLVAHELYAGVAQTLASVLLMLRVSDPATPEGRTGLEQVRTELVGALEDIRRLARRLRPPELDDLGLRAALEAHVRSIRAGGGPEVRWVGDVPELEPEVTTALFRVVQAAVDNALGHAGARRVRVSLGARGGHVTAEVRDDGRGFEPTIAFLAPSESLGLQSMRERVDHLGGRLVIDAGPGRGSRVRVEIPQYPARSRATALLREGDTMVDKILVPLDGSKFAEAALPMALAISRGAGADMHLVMVLEPAPSFALDEWGPAAIQWSKEYLDGVAARARRRAGGTVSTSLGSGHVVEELVREAEALPADLIVMATHGRGAFTRMWLGSVADGLVRRSTLPLLLSRPPEEGETDLSVDAAFHKILVPLDGSELSEHALADAVELGAPFGADFHLVRIVPYPVDLASPYLPHTVQVNRSMLDEARRAAAEYLAKHADRLRARGMHVSTEVRVDPHVGPGILEETERVGADLIAMATHGRGGLTRAILGSATDKVVRGATVPILVHRPPPVRATREEVA